MVHPLDCSCPDCWHPPEIERDYIRIAQVLTNVRDTTDISDDTYTVLVKQMADMLKTDNQAFDYEQFVKACDL